jgi:hypothetical protein
MRIYAAGGITRNLNGIFKRTMRAYLVGAIKDNRAYIFDSRSKEEIERQMQIHLADNDGYRKLRFKLDELNILESFYYIRAQEWMYPLLKTFKSFMLDSGAFTYMESGKTADWDAYVDEYGDFVKAQGIELFFELDIDSIVGLPKVEELRVRLEKRAGRKCIPVWHRARGWSDWVKLCKRYDYVSIGGIVSGEITSRDFPIFTKMLKYAHERGVKVHGLGFTNYKGMLKYKFDSVDSTAWLYGNRGGFLYRFNGRGLDKIQAPKGVRLKPIESAIHNFTEWVKFAKFAEVNL